MFDLIFYGGIISVLTAAILKLKGRESLSKIFTIIFLYGIVAYVLFTVSGMFM